MEKNNKTKIYIVLAVIITFIITIQGINSTIVSCESQKTKEDCVSVIGCFWYSVAQKCGQKTLQDKLRYNCPKFSSLISQYFMGKWSSGYQIMAEEGNEDSLFNKVKIEQTEEGCKITNTNKGKKIDSIYINDFPKDSQVIAKSNGKLKVIISGEPNFSEVPHGNAEISFSEISSSLYYKGKKIKAIDLKVSNGKFKGKEFSIDGMYFNSPDYKPILVETKEEIKKTDLSSFAGISEDGKFMMIKGETTFDPYRKNNLDFIDKVEIKEGVFIIDRTDERAKEVSVKSKNFHYLGVSSPFGRFIFEQGGKGKKIVSERDEILIKNGIVRKSNVGNLLERGYKVSINGKFISDKKAVKREGIENSEINYDKNKGLDLERRAPEK